MIDRSGARTQEELDNLLDGLTGGGGIPDLPPATNRERATDLCCEAQTVRARRELQLLREALRLDPDCADAYLMLSRRESDPAAAEALCRQALAAARRALGEKPFTVPGYPFWGAHESRPFMRAMDALAQVLEAQGRDAEAGELLAEMLRLNPGDNQGVRDRYVPLLIRQGRLDDARAVIESDLYREDIGAVFDFAAALIAHRQARFADADAALANAMRKNRFVRGMILDPDALPPGGLHAWSPGDESEAVMIADLLGDAWRAEESAVKWLGAARPPARARKAGKGSKGGGGGRQGKRKPKSS
jgi:tetratricopeptide (TPR) repeat protein